MKLIDFLLRPEVAAQVEETIAKGEWQNDVGSASTLYETYFQQLKAGR